MNKNFEPTLEDLDDDNFVDPNTPDPSKTDEESQEQEEEEEETEEDEKDSEGEEEEESEETDEEEKDEENEDTESEDESQQFFEELSTEVGFNIDDLEIEFEEGEDRLGASGIAKIIQGASEKALLEFDSHLKNNYPDAYELFLTLQGGGSIKEFVENFDVDAPSVITVEAVTDSIDVQKKIVKEDLIRKGLKDKIADATIKQMEDDDELLEHALDVQKELQSEREAKINELSEKAAKKIEEEKALTDLISQETSKILNTGIIGKNKTLPKTSRKAAVESFTKNLRVEGGKVYHVTEVDLKNIPAEVARVHYNNVGLDKVIEVKAKTEHAKRVKLSLKNEDKVRGRAGSGKSKNAGGHIPLGELED